MAFSILPYSCPVFQNAPIYKLAKHYTIILNNRCKLPYSFNIHNSMNLIADLQEIDMSGNVRLCSFDIKNIYSNISTQDINKVIIDIAKKNHLHNDVIQEVEQLTNLIIEQNYFEMDSKFYHQSEGLAIGAPSSALLAEIYLQSLEHNQILHLLLKHKILSYRRYVDDILITYDTTNANINNTLSDFNKLHHKIQFTIENELNNQINFLDIPILRHHNNLQFGTYRKHTATDIMIHNDSCHPNEHKMSGINYLINRITTYPITQSNLNIIINNLVALQS
jgi:hypothetical protein